MNKQKGFVPKVTPELLVNVEAVLAMADKSRYSATKVYAAYNAVTGKSDPPQTCASCLRNRVKALRQWYADYTSEAKKRHNLIDEHPFDAAQYVVSHAVDPIGVPDDQTLPPSEDETPDVGNGGAPIDVIRLHSPSLEKPLYFQPGSDPMKGKVQYEGGGAVKPGKYELSDGRELAVQPGGKATLKEAPAENDLL